MDYKVYYIYKHLLGHYSNLDMNGVFEVIHKDMFLEQPWAAWYKVLLSHAVPRKPDEWWGYVMAEPVDIVNMYVYMLGRKTVRLVHMVSEITQNNNITLRKPGVLGVVFLDHTRCPAYNKKLHK